MFSAMRSSLIAFLALLILSFVSPVQATVTFAGVDGVDAAVLTTGGCAGCHGTGTTSYTSCTGTATMTAWLASSTQSSRWTSTKACATDIDGKITSSPPYGVQMPDGGPYLSAATQSLFNTWVTTDGELLSTTPNYASTTASSVTNKSATLNMSVYANGTAVTAAYFKYSTNSTTVSGGGGTQVNVSASVPTASGGGTSSYALSVGTGSILTCGTTYYYRAYATNSDGTMNNGSNKSFSTSACTGPSITEASPLTTSTNEDTQTTFTLHDSDIDYGTLTWSVQTQGSLGTYSFDTSTTGSPVTVRYTPNANANGSDTAGVIKATNGSDGLTATISIHMTVNSVNDTPVVTTSVSSINYKGGSGAKVVDSGITVSDVDSSATTYGQIKQATVAITNYVAADGESLACGAAVTGITCSFNSSSGVLTLSGVTTPANYTTALQGVTYDDPLANPTTGSRTVQFVVQDNSGLSNATSTANNVTVVVATASTPPTISGFSGTTSFTEQTPVVVDNSVTFADTDSGSSLDQVQMTLTTNRTANDSLVCPTSGLPSGITCSYSAPTLTLSSSTTNSFANYTTAVGLVKFNNTSNKPSINNRTVTLVARDNTNTVSTTASRTITITTVNDKPVITSTAPSAATVVITENVASNVYQVTQTDPDDTSFTYSLSGAPSGMAISSTGLVTWTPPRTGVFNKVTGTITVTVTDTNSSGASNGVQSTTQTFNLATSPPDSDGDGVADYSDNCPSVANPTQADMDNDTYHILPQTDPSGIPASGDVDPTHKDANGFLTGGDACDEDIDGDGMPNTFENMYSFLNPMDPTDASKDYSGDGLTNLQEYRMGYDPSKDNVAPVVTAPRDISVNATGYLTDVSLGTATANDGVSGSVSIIVPIIDTTISLCSDLSNYPMTPPPLRPGLHEANWTTCDSSGNLAYATQNVRVLPILNTTAGQTVGAGQTAVVEVMLNGPAADYPVTVHYQAGGTASSSDYDITSGTLTINQTDVDGNTPGLVARLPVHIASSIAQDETLTVALSSAVNAHLGPLNVSQINIVNHDTTPVLTSAVTQNGVATGQVVYANAGPVVLTVNTSDTSSATRPAFDWSMSDNTINGIGSVASTANSSTLTFDPSGLAQGLYPIVVTVNDNGKTNTISYLLKVDATAPNLADCNLDGVADVPANNDCDGDGVLNTTEGAIDSNGNGIPDYLDDNRIKARNVIQNETGDPANTYLLMTDPGLQLRLGTTALASGDAGVLVSQQNINNHGGKDGTAGINPQDSYINDGGFYDFEVTGLTDAITSAHVVIPLQSAILNDAVYRKYSGSAWSSFVVDANNTISSAPGNDGVCPAPGSTDYTLGLSPLDYCVELTIQDGGPNDADGVRNYVIRDPGGVATPAPATSQTQDTTKASTGLVNPALLLLMLTVLFLLAPHRREVIRRCMREKQQ